MSRNDGRKLDHKTLEAIRTRAVQQVESGESPEVVIKALGFTRARIYEWLAAYRKGRYEALKAKRLLGRPTKLTGKQIGMLYKIVTLKNPLQLKFPFALWTRSMIREVIRDQFGVRLSEVSVGRLLRKIGLSPQPMENYVFSFYPRILQSSNRMNRFGTISSTTISAKQSSVVPHNLKHSCFGYCT